MNYYWVHLFFFFFPSMDIIREPVWRYRWDRGLPGVRINCSRSGNEGRRPARPGASQTGRCYPGKGRSPAPPLEAGSRTCVTNNEAERKRNNVD